MRSIADEILMYRAQENLSQAAFAQRAGLSKGTISGIESGVQKPTPRTEMKIRLVITKKENEK